MKYRFTPTARRELTNIWLYTADHWGVDQADRYVRDIEHEIEFAIKFPEIGGSVIGLPAEYRKIKSGSHRAIYRVNGDELIVVRILHERQDVPDEIEDFE